MKKRKQKDKWDSPKLLNRKELAKALGCSVSSVDKWKDIRFPIVRLGPRRQGFDLADVQKALRLGAAWKSDPKLCRRYNLSAGESNENLEGEE